MKFFEKEKAKETETKPWEPYLLIMPAHRDATWENALEAPIWDPIPKEIEDQKEEPTGNSRKILDI